MRLLVALFVALNLTGAAAVKVKIPPGVALEERDVRAVLPERLAAGRNDSIEIVIYHFSLGVEKLSYGDSDELNESAMAGSIKALIKLKKKNVLARALFISASGSDREDILRNFSRALMDMAAKL